MADPIAEAFRNVVQEVYWTESLEEAEKILEDYLNMIDDDLREILLEQRRRICEDPASVIELVRLNAIAEIADSEDLSKIILTKSMIESGFLFQCTRRWSTLDNATKSKILAPLYKASYGFELAMKNWPGSIDQVHLDIALQMASIALERADQLGILDEFREYIDSIVERLVEDEADGQ